MVNRFRKKSNKLQTTNLPCRQAGHQPRTKAAFGFTLIELLVVMSIMAVLAGGVLYSTNHARDKGKDAKRKQDLQALSTALVAFYVDHQQYPPVSGLAQLAFTSDSTNNPWIPELANYISKIPKDPQQSSISTYFAKTFGNLNKLATTITKPKTPTKQGQVAGTTTVKLGIDTIGANTDQWSANNFNGSKATTGATGGATSRMYVYVREPISDPNNDDFQLAIYSNDAATGKPKTLIASTAIGTLSNISGWNSLPITATLSANTTYWLMYNNNGATQFDNNAANSLGVMEDGAWFSQTFGTAPATATSVSNQAGIYSIYVEYSYTTTAPTVTTSAASDIASTTATLNGSANPNGDATTGWFRYSTTSPGANCNDTFGTRAPTSGGSALGSGSTTVAYPAQNITDLNPSSKYYFCAIASNTNGVAYGTVRNFTTLATPSAPTVTTSAASGISATTATLRGSANPKGAATTGWFRYRSTDPGTTPCTDDASFGARAPTPSGGTSLGSGSTATSYNQNITGLNPSTTYYFCAIANNSSGTTFGSVATFTTSTSGVEEILGYDTVGANIDCCDQQKLQGSKFTMGANAGTVSKMKVNVGAVGASPNNKYVLAIYNDVGGKPGTVIANSAQGTLTANDWNELTLTTTLNANTTYWLMYGTNGTAGNTTDDHLNNPKVTYSGTNNAAFFGAPFETFPSGSDALLENQTYSIYATYTTGPPGVSASLNATTPINYGASTTLSWNSTGTTACTIDNGIGPVSAPGSGSIVKGPLTEAKTFNLTCDGASASATVAINLTPEVGWNIDPGDTEGNKCDGKSNIYCLRVSENKKAFVLWAQLENTNDPEKYENENAKCQASDFAVGSIYEGLGQPAGSNLNYCVKSPQ